MNAQREGDSPRGWEIAALRDIAWNIRPRENPKAYPNLPFIGMEHVEAHTMKLMGTVPAFTMSSNAVHFHPGDVLYGRLRPYLNKVLVAEFEGMCSAEFIPLTTPEGVDPRYLAYSLNSAPFVSFASHINEGDRPRVDFGEIGNYRLGIPPSREQRQIVEAIESHFTRLDAAVATLERVKANLKRYRASVLKAAVEGRLVPTEAELARKEGRSYEPASVLLERTLKERRRRWEGSELGRIRAAGNHVTDNRWKNRYPEPVGPDFATLPRLPEGWCWASVDMVGDVLLGRQRAPQYLRGLNPRPYLRVANVKDDALDLSDVETMDFDEKHLAKYRLEVGDILVSEGQSPELVGQSAIYHGHGGTQDLCFQKTLHRFRPIPPGPGSAYVQLVFRAHVRNGVFMRLASITTNIAHLTLEKFRASPFPLPPSLEQDRIVTEAARLLSIADSVEATVFRDQRGVSRLRQSVLRWAFEGKLVDQDTTDEPAPVLLERIKAERKKAGSAHHKTPRGGPRKATA